MSYLRIISSFLQRCQGRYWWAKNVMAASLGSTEKRGYGLPAWCASYRPELLFQFCWLQFLWLEVSPLCHTHSSWKVRGGSKANQLEGWTLGESECVSKLGKLKFFTFIFQQILLLFQFLRLRPRPFYMSLQPTVSDTALWQRPWW